MNEYPATGRVSYLMNDFFSELNRLVRNGQAPSVLESLDPVKPDENVVGSCSPRVRVLLSELERLKAKFGDYEACLDGEDPNTDRFSVWESEKHLIEHKIRVLTSLLWIFVREDIPVLAKKAHIGIRQNWAVIYSDKLSQDDGADMILKVLSTFVREPSVAGNN